MYVIFLAIITVALILGAWATQFDLEKIIPTPPEASSTTPGYGRFGNYCITPEALDELMSGPTVFSCDGKEYVLAAENVKVDRVYIYSEKKLTLKTTCDTIPYYSWYCHPPDYGSLWQNTLWKAVPDANKTIADGDLFNIYIQRNPDPDSYFICGSIPFDLRADPGDALMSTAATEGEAPKIAVGGNEASLSLVSTAPPGDIENVPTRKKIDTVTVTLPDGSNKEYDVWVNLLKAFSPDEGEAYYLVEKNFLPNSNGFTMNTPYLKYIITVKIIPFEGHDGLQLQTFKLIPTPALKWWDIYLPESKPVVYLYPEERTQIKVEVKPAKGFITVSDPLYPKEGWNVVADQNSAITYKNATYPYLYYETEVAGYDIPLKGYVFEKKNIKENLKTLVEQLGLKGSETKDFVDYWVKRFEKDVNSNYIFTGVISESEQDMVVPLKITPRPDTVIRVRLYFKEVEIPYSPVAPVLPKEEGRKGFTVVEWGGILDE